MHDAKHEDETFSGEVGINMPGCIEALRKLKAEGHTLILISFCGKKRAVATRKYFYKFDEPLFDHYHFVKKRSFKKDVCAKYGVDIMIDDRLDILKTVAPTKTMWFVNDEFFRDPKDTEKFIPDISTQSWEFIPSIISVTPPAGLKPKPEIDISRLCH